MLLLMGPPSSGAGDRRLAITLAATGGAAFRRRPGVGAQVMGPDDGYIVQYRRGGFIFFHARGATGRGAALHPDTHMAPFASNNESSDVEDNRGELVYW